MTSPTTDPNQERREPAKINGHISTLSMELMTIPENEQAFIFEHFEEALRKNLIAALPDEKQTFKATYIDRSGKQVTERKHEKHIVVNPAWEKWVNEQCERSRYHQMKIKGDFATTADRITANPEEFELMLKMRREELIWREREAKTETPPVAKTTAKPSTSGKNSPKRKGTASSKPTTPKHSIVPETSTDDTGSEAEPVTVV